MALVSLCTLGAAHVASAQSLQAFPATPPSLGAPKAFTPPPIDERRLANGLTTNLIPFGSARVAFVQLVIDAGRMTDPPDRHGLASVVAAYLREGSATRDRSAFNRQAGTLGLIGGGIQVVVNDAQTIVSGQVLSDSVGGLIRLIGSLVREPAFPAEALSRLKASEARQASNRAAQTAVRATWTADSLLFGDAAIRDATDSSVARIALADVRDLWSRSYTAANATLYVSGVFDRAVVNREISQAFGSWTKDEKLLRATAARQPSDAPTPNAGQPTPVIHLIDRPGATQARIVVAYAVVDPGSPDYFALNELNIVMGSVQTARIIANVRETHGYSYNISSRLSTRPGSSKWIVSGDVANGVVGPALREILAEVDRVRETPLTESELRSFQTFMAGVLVSENSTPDGIVSTLDWQRLYGVDRGYLSSFVQRVFAVTPADIHSVAQRYLAQSRAAIIVIGDRKAIEAQLALIGRIE